MKISDSVAEGMVNLHF